MGGRGRLIAPAAELALAVEVGSLQRAVAHHFADRPGSMLDVGCGYGRPSGLLANHVVGVDPDAAAIEANTCVDEKVVGTLDAVDLKSETYDIVVAWNVLEHLERPIDDLRRMAKSVVRGGILVLAFPNVDSVRGRITRYTPTWFHRVVIRKALRGRGAEPYKTFMDDALDVDSVVAMLEGTGFTTLHLSQYEGYHELRLRELHPVVGIAWQRLTRLLSTLSRGRLDYRSDVMGAFVRT